LKLKQDQIPNEQKAISLFFLPFLWGWRVAPTRINPFATGPTYDAAANLEIDRKWIDTYWATADIDSL